VAAAAACTSPPSPPVLQEIPLPEPVETCSVRELRVKATAYNSVPSQTDDTPNLTAFGTRLSPDTRAVDVSRDLEAKGLTHCGGLVTTATKLPTDGTKKCVAVF
jgi:hypothetical protein